VFPFFPNKDCVGPFPSMAEPLVESFFFPSCSFKSNIFFFLPPDLSGLFSFGFGPDGLPFAVVRRDPRPFLFQVSSWDFFS